MCIDGSCVVSYAYACVCIVNDVCVLMMYGYVCLCMLSDAYLVCLGMGSYAYVMFSYALCMVSYV